MPLCKPFHDQAAELRVFRRARSNLCLIDAHNHWKECGEFPIKHNLLKWQTTAPGIVASSAINPGGGKIVARFIFKDTCIFRNSSILFWMDFVSFAVAAFVQQNNLEIGDDRQNHFALQDY
jgi:hypothetical protein